MPTLRSSKSGQGLQAPVSPPKGTRKVQKGRTVKSKVAKTNKVNNLLPMVPNTAEDSDVSTVPLPTLPYLSGFGSMLDDSNPLTHRSRNYFAPIGEKNMRVNVYI